ncbi:hypothetical protein CHISP_1056 [Chitinispirillum alkaliphilum]|nr:hypothetical protein CHISP_1056 [Chitinispirillum alkaliphilum]
MKNQQTIGIASSVSAHCGYDPFDTLSYAVKNNISSVQLYLDRSLMQSPSDIDRLSQIAKESNISLVCHSPEFLNRKTTKDTLIDGMNRLLKHQQQRAMIVHFDSEVGFEEITEIVKELNHKNIVPYLENFYPAGDEYRFLSSFSRFNSVFALSAQEKLQIVPVIDIPRLFISNIVENFDPLLLTKLLFTTLSEHEYEPVLHLIDFTDFSQNRDSWCPVGKGKMPYREIFSFLKREGITPTLSILEFEQKEHVSGSIEWLKENF